MTYFGKHRKKQICRNLNSVYMWPVLFHGTSHFLIIPTLKSKYSFLPPHLQKHREIEYFAQGHTALKSLNLNAGSPDPDSGLFTTSVSVGPHSSHSPCCPSWQLCLHCPQVGPHSTYCSFIPGPVNGQDCCWPTARTAFFDLEHRKPLSRSSPEPGVGISIAELLASGDRVLSVVPHDLVAKGWVQVQLWLFLETLLLFLYFA